MMKRNRLAVQFTRFKSVCHVYFYAGRRRGQSRAALAAARLGGRHARSKRSDRFRLSKTRRRMRDKMLRPRKPLQIIEVKIGRGQLLSKQNDLSRMHREMLRHVKDCFERCHLSSLYLKLRE